MQVAEVKGEIAIARYKESTGRLEGEANPVGHFQKVNQRKKKTKTNTRGGVQVDERLRTEKNFGLKKGSTQAKLETVLGSLFGG